MPPQSASSATNAQRASYNKAWLRGDVLAGLTTAAVVVPKTMAFAAIAGLPAEAGLYAAFAPMLIYAALGTSRVLSVSSTSAIAILTAAALSQVNSELGSAELLTAALTLSMLVGVILMLAGVLRLGFLANFISDPVLTGFKAGVGVLIIVDQLPKLLGVHIEKAGVFRDLVHVAQVSPEASVPTLILALATLALLLVVERYLPRAPAPLMAVIGGIAVSFFFALGDVGAIRAGLPDLRLPDPALALMLAPAAFGIALMSFTESITTGRAFAGSSEARPHADRELIALGAANVAGGLTGSLPAGGGASQTAVNVQAGAKSRMASVVTASATLAVLMAFASQIALLPLATLAAIVVVTAAPLIDPREFRAIFAVRRTEFYWALVAAIGVAWLGALNGVLVAIAISILTLLYQANRPPVYVLTSQPGSNVFRPVPADGLLDEAHPGLLILRTEGRMHFANAERVGDTMWRLVHQAQPRVVLLDCSAVPDIEYTALRMLIDAEAKLRSADVSLWLASLSPRALRVVYGSGLAQTLGRERMFFDVPSAVAAWHRYVPPRAREDASVTVDSGAISPRDRSR